MVAGVFGAMTLGARDDFNVDPSAATRDAFHRDKAITNVAITVAGVAAAAAGVVMWLTLPRSHENAPTTVGISADGITARVRF